MKPTTLALSCVAVALVTGLVTNWIRHWPSNLTRGTQLILLVGMMVQVGFVGAAIVFLLRGCAKTAL